MPRNEISECSTAVRLNVIPSVFLNQLFHYPEVHLVVRAGGISVFRRTQFGIFHPHVVGDDTRLHDPVSGLRTDPDLIQRIWYIPGGATPPCFEIEFSGIDFSLAIFPGTDADAKRYTASLLAECAGSEIALDDLRARGASTWLDEGLFSHGNHWHNHISLSGADEESINLELRSPALEADCRIRPARVDHSGSVWRLSDTSADTVVHLDPQHPGFCPDGALLISHRIAAIESTGNFQTKPTHHAPVIHN